MSARRPAKGDTVTIESGPHAGQTGAVLWVSPDARRIQVALANTKPVYVFADELGS